ncbi:MULTISPECIES: glycosyltransferase [Roseobacteraceae]|uniref:glycosyltransferase n=1 Tax=Roseobacteraceae TaxID=2854170 RepID=UPI0031CEEF7C
MIDDKTVVMFPARQNKADNPYLHILTSALAQAETRVVPFSPWQWSQPTEVFHIHWLEAFTWNRFAKRSMIARRILAERILDHARAVARRGGKVVWTAHNIAPHDGFRDDPVFRAFSEEMLELITDVISMSRPAQAALIDRYPQLAKVRHEVIPHPHYRQYFEGLDTHTPESCEAASALDGRLLLVFGMIRPYKRVPEIVEAFRGLQGQNRMVILGGGHEDECARVRDAMQNDPRIDFRQGRYEDAQLRDLLRRADLSVFNFDNILNSGSVLTALSLSCPVIAPSHDVLLELRDEVGGEWMQLFEGSLTAEAIRCSLETPRVAQTPDFSASDPAVIAHKHAELYFG